MYFQLICKRSLCCQECLDLRQLYKVETFAPVGGSPQGKPIGVLWHEAVSGRSAEDVASSYIKLIRENRDVQKFVFWADNCSAQNKNWYIFTALVHEVNREIGSLNSVTIKYFEPGHTFMSADSFHHQIEQGMRTKKRVDNFEDFVSIVNSKGKSIVMKFDDFYHIPKGVSQAKYAQHKPKLDLVQIVEFRKGSTKMFWKGSHIEEEFKEAEFLQRKLQNNFGKFNQKSEPRVVATSKRDEIISKLCPHMKENRREFWYNLFVNDRSVDLVEERDPNENDTITNEDIEN